MKSGCEEGKYGIKNSKRREMVREGYDEVEGF